LPQRYVDFVDACVEKRQFPDATELVKAALELLAAENRRRFNEELDAAAARVDAGEFYTIDEVLAEMDDIIEAAEKKRA
jgi:Arc/MetJ-type ribon-helix-helix transcriptional regulator